MHHGWRRHLQGAIFLPTAHLTSFNSMQGRTTRLAPVGRASEPKLLFRGYVCLDLVWCKPHRENLCPRQTCWFNKIARGKKYDVVRLCPSNSFRAFTDQLPVWQQKFPTRLIIHIPQISPDRHYNVQIRGNIAPGGSGVPRGQISVSTMLPAPLNSRSGGGEGNMWRESFMGL